MADCDGSSSYSNCELTPALVIEAVKHMRGVLSLKHTAWLLKRPQTTLDTWDKRGKEAMEQGVTPTSDHPRAIHVDFHLKIREAQAECALEMLGNIRAAIPGWQANAWLLERVFREEFNMHGDLEKRIGDKVEYLRDQIARLMSPNAVVPMEKVHLKHEDYVYAKKLDSKGDKTEA